MVAETDDGTLDRVVELVEPDEPPSEAERTSVTGRLDRIEYRFYAALSRRASLVPPAGFPEVFTELARQGFARFARPVAL